MSTPRDDSSLPLIHDPESGVESYPGLDDAPTQVKPHAALVAAGSAPEAAGESVSPQILGARLDHFELLDSIGVGGMGRVFRARDTRLDRLVALKVLSPELSGDVEICRRFEQEAKAAARLDDRHFARVFFFGFDKGLRYIAMEYVEGENIRQKIQRSGRLSVSLVVNIAIQIARGLSHAAACGVVHRDIKPSNIILTPDGTAKLVDMGLARNFFQQSSPASELTQAGVTLGTFDYISPEQALDPRDADVRSDIYSLGCTLYHALTGRPPFSKGSALQKILQHQNDAVPEPRRFAPELPEPIVSILMKMLAKEPRERYQHPAELIDDLRAVAGLLDIPLPDEQDFAPPSLQRPSVMDGIWGWLLPLAIFLTAVAIYAWLDRPTQPGRPTPILPEDQGEAVSRQQKDRMADPLTPASEGADAPLGRWKSRSVAVGEDLVAILNAAPPETEFRLASDRYELSSDARSDASIQEILVEKNLRLCPADPVGRVEIVVRGDGWAQATQDSHRSSAIFRVAGGTLDIDRVDFLIESPDRAAAPLSLIQLEGGRVRINETYVQAVAERRQVPLDFIRVHDSARRESNSIAIFQSLIFGVDHLVRIDGDVPTGIECDQFAADAIQDAPFLFDSLADVRCRIQRSTVRAMDASMFVLRRWGGHEMLARQCVFACSRRSNGPIRSSASPAFVSFQREAVWVDRDHPWWVGSDNVFVGFEPVVLARSGNSIASGLEQARTLGFEESQQWPGGDNGRLTLPDIPKELPLAVESGRQIASTLSLTSDPALPRSAPGFGKSPWESTTDQEVAQGPGYDATADSRKIEIELGGPNPSGELRRAIAEAPQGAQLFIKGNGLIPISQIPIQDKSVHLRAATGFSPILTIAQSREDLGSAEHMFRLGGNARLCIEGIPIVLATPEESLACVAELSPGSEFVVQDSAVLIDATNTQSRCVLARIADQRAESPEWSKPSRLTLLRSTLRTMGRGFDGPVGNWNVSIVDSFVVAASPLCQLLPTGRMASRSRSTLGIERSTILLGGVLFNFASAALSEGPGIDVHAQKSLILGCGSTPLFLATISTDRPTDGVVNWTGRDSVLAGFETAWRVGSRTVEGVGESLHEQSAPEWLGQLGEDITGIQLAGSEPYALTQSRIVEESPPTAVDLERTKIIAGPAGVDPRLLPAEPNRESASPRMTKN